MENGSLALLANKFRKSLTEAERKLWGIIRRKQLGGFRFRRQVVFGKFVLDFVCFDPKIVIEVDGGQHNDEENKKYDRLRTEYLQSHGYRVLRFWNFQIFNEIEVVAEEILRNCLIPPS